MSDSEIPPVVVDSGSGSFKVGLAGETDPFVFSPTVGRPKHSSYYQVQLLDYGRKPYLKYVFFYFCARRCSHGCWDVATKVIMLGI